MSRVARVKVVDVMDNALSAVKEKGSNKVTSRGDDYSVIPTKEIVGTEGNANINVIHDARDASDKMETTSEMMITGKWM